MRDKFVGTTSGVLGGSEASLNSNWAPSVLINHKRSEAVSSFTVDTFFFFFNLTFISKRLMVRGYIIAVLVYGLRLYTSLLSYLKKKKNLVETCRFTQTSII